MVSAQGINVSSMTTVIKLTFVTFGDFGNHVGNAFFVVVIIQHYSLSSEIYFLGGRNKKGSCVVGKMKRQQYAVEVL